MADFDRADLAPLAAALVPAVLAAGTAIMRIYAEDFAVEVKGDQSPVTAADAAGEQILLAALSQRTPQVPVVAEEQAAAGQIPDIGQGPFWLVDPLDGTKEFIKRNGEFTVNVGLIDQRQPCLGLVLAPALGRLYVGVVNRDAHGQETAQGFQQAVVADATGALQLAGAPQPLACRRPPAAGLTVLASRSHGTDAELKQALETFLSGRLVAETINAGSSLKFCRVAEGAADLYPRLGPTCEWDTAAAHAVLRAAGGEVTLLDGQPFLYGKAPTFLNPGFVALTSALMQESF